MSVEQFGQFTDRLLEGRVARAIRQIQRTSYECCIVDVLCWPSTCINGVPIDELLTPAELRVLFAIVVHVDHNAECRVSIETIAREIGRDRANVRRLRDSLVAKGVIEKAGKPPGERERSRACCYRMPKLVGDFTAPMFGAKRRLPYELEVAALIASGQAHAVTLTLPHHEADARRLLKLGFSVTLNFDTGIALVERPGKVHFG